MAVDTDLARELASDLQALQPFSKVATVQFTHDDYLEDFSETRIRVMPESLQQLRLSRNHWSADVVIKLVFEARQQQNTTEAEPDAQENIDSWLDFVDEVIGHIKTLTPSGKKAKEITFESRYNRDFLRQNNLFQTTALVAYSLVEQ